MIVGLAVYFYRKTRQQGHAVENEDPNEEEGIGPGTALDLNKSMSSLQDV